MKIILALLFVTSFLSCTKGPSTPEGLLVMFTKDITTKNMTRAYFYKHTTGKMKSNIEELSDEDFEKYRNLSKVKNPRVSVSDKNCDETKCSLTYIVKYDYRFGGPKSDVFKSEIKVKSEVKKLAKLVKEEESWKISEVTNIKTFHESADPLEVLQTK